MHLRAPGFSLVTSSSLLSCIPNYVQSADIKVGIQETCLEMRKIRFLVKDGWLEPETVNNIVDSLRAILQGFILFLRRGVGTWMPVDWSDIHRKSTMCEPISTSLSLMEIMAQSTS